MGLLSKVTSGVINRPRYILMHGIPGIGKSTFASEAPNPIFLCAEKGTDRLDVTRLELQSFDDFLTALNELATIKHDYKTLVIDTVDHLEPLIFKKVCADKGKNSIIEIGYGNGYVLALEYWNQLVSAWESLRENNGMNVILLAHTVVKKFNDPQLAEGYDQYQVKLHDKASGLLIDRVEDVLFVNYKKYINAKEGERTKAFSDHSRVIYSLGGAAYVAKNRNSLPLELPLSWDDYISAVENKKPKSAEEMLNNIEELLGRVVDVEMKNKIASHIEKVKGSVVELKKVKDRLTTIVSVA